MTLRKNETSTSADPAAVSNSQGGPSDPFPSSAASKRKMKVRVLPGRCMGHARCAAAAPDVYKLDDNGYLQMPPTEVAPRQEELARRGARACPERAIVVDQK
jgi:ferredoxin